MPWMISERQKKLHSPVRQVELPETMRADTLALSQIERLTRNPKAHDLGTLHRSMNRFGYLERIVINETTGRMIAGHGRCETLTQKAPIHLRIDLTRN